MRHRKALCCVLNAAQGFFRFWRFWTAYSMPCTQGAHLHFTDSDDMQLNHKRSPEAVYQLHDTANRGTVQSIRADGRYFTDQVSIDFSHRISSPYSSEANINLGGQRLRMSALILDG